MGYGGMFAGIGELVVWGSAPSLLIGLFVGLAVMVRPKAAGVYWAMTGVVLVVIGLLVATFGKQAIIALAVAPFGVVAGLILSLLIALPILLSRYYRSQPR